MRAAFIALTLGCSAIAVSVFACGGDDSTNILQPGKDGAADTTNNGDAELPDNVAPDTSPPCTDTRCKKVACTTGTTNLSGTVYDPAGKRTLYNVIVYIPNTTPDAITNGATCDRCGKVSGDPIVSAVTDANGNFTLKDVPVGTDIPLVIQTGKWRRQVKVPNVSACVDNTVSPSLTRLPRKASEGDMPIVAIASSCDPIECTLRKFGIDDSEFTVGSGTGHVRVYALNGSGMQKVGNVATTPATGLWQTDLQKYDMLINSCECQPAADKGLATYAAVKTFLDNGGRVLGTHYEYDFFAAPHGPAEFQAAAEWTPGNAPQTNSPAFIDTSIPKGQAFSDWLVGNLGSKAGQVSLDPQLVRQDVGNVRLATTRYVRETAVADGGGAESTKYLSFNTPTLDPDGGVDAGALSPAKQCGRAAFADFHALNAGNNGGPTAFPDACSNYPTSLGDEEYAFEFMFFELGSCVQDETLAPVPPMATP